MDDINITVPQDAFEALVAKQVEEALKSRGLDGDDPTLPQDASDMQKFGFLTHVWHNNGWANPEDRLKYEPQTRHKHAVDFTQLVDMMQPDKAVIFFPKLITQVVREAVEPVLVLSQLMRRINFHGETITYPAISNSMFAEDIGPGMEYPEGSIEAAGVVTAKIGKSGIAFKISDEVLRYSMFDVANLYFRAAGRALARHKEQKVSDMIHNETSVAFDNLSLGTGHGNTTGRGFDGEYNGTLALDDLFVTYADLINQGFLPNTLIMNALGWLIFARSPELRAFGFANGGPMWMPLQGQPGQGPALSTGGVNMGPSVGQPLSGGNPQSNPQASTYTNVPNMFPAPLQIIVSPFIRFNNSTQRTDIIMADRNELGILVQDEDPMSESWDRPERDIRYTKIRERYALAIDNEGEAAYQIKNVKIIRGWSAEDHLNWPVTTGGALPSGTAGV